MDGENCRFVFTHIPFYLPACKELVRYYIIIIDSPSSLGISGSYCSKVSYKPVSFLIASYRKRADANCLHIYTSPLPTTTHVLVIPPGF